MKWTLPSSKWLLQTKHIENEIEEITSVGQRWLKLSERC
ncbi:hypothetical protein M8C21_018502, partial [Ambrosia artemisiifolia]